MSNKQIWKHGQNAGRTLMQSQTGRWLPNLGTEEQEGQNLSLRGTMPVAFQFLWYVHVIGTFNAGRLI